MDRDADDTGAAGLARVDGGVRGDGRALMRKDVAGRAAEVVGDESIALDEREQKEVLPGKSCGDANGFAGCDKAVPVAVPDHDRR